MISAILTCAFGTRDQIPHLRQSEPVSRFSLTVFTDVERAKNHVSGRLPRHFVYFCNRWCRVCIHPSGHTFLGLQTEDLAYLVYVGLFGFL